MTLEEKIQEEDKIITLAEARIFFNGCIAGWKLLCKLHDISYKEVVLYGLPASRLYAMEDSMVNSLLEWVYNGRK